MYPKSSPSIFSPVHPLSTSQGFPRGDLDLPAIRADRHTVITLTNDHKQLTDTMAHLLEQLHSQAREKGNGAVTAPTTTPTPPSSSYNTIDRHTIAVAATTTNTITISQHQLKKPFATVNAVSPDSPASEAGLQVGDGVVDFGGAVGMSELPSLVSANENKDVVVMVDRGGRMVELKVRPRVWSGRGLLGCHLMSAMV